MTLGRRLRAYLRNLGLRSATYVNEDGDDVELSDELYEELGGLSSSYLNYLQNNWGPESQGFHLVLDKSYSPTPGSDEHEVFQAMKVHMCIGRPDNATLDD